MSVRKLYTQMKNKRFDFRVTESRYKKLTLIAKKTQRSVASLFDEWIDSLPDLEKQATKPLINEEKS